MKVLLAIDSSDFSEAAIAAVEHRPWPNNAEFVVLHIVNDAGLSFGWELPPLTEIRNDSAERLVKLAALRLSEKGLKVSTRVLSGYPPQAVPAYIREWGADLAVVGSHGTRGLVRFLLGSVSRSVLKSTQCSVEIVRPERQPRAEGPIKILIGTDGSEYSQRAIEAIAQRPWPKGSVVKVISVVETPPVGIDAWNTVSVIQEILETQTNAALRWVSEAARILSAAGLETLTQVIPGYAKALIIDQAEGWAANLVVVGSHGRLGFDRLVLGSVAESVALHCHCSVEVIRSAHAG
jgi:nucleotide-binding universal stress UspA family protein